MVIQNKAARLAAGLASSRKPMSSYRKANCPSRFNQGVFNKALLPMPVAVLARIGIKPRTANRAGYWQVCCPFHKGGEEKNASLSMHQVKGNFRCFACGAHGGDVLSFWMQYTGKSFKHAAQELGAWEGGAL
ncbi:DNA primase [Methylophilaceae bacterium]|nr:DNA primase [Methylophilaceae bacterium]